MHVSLPIERVVGRMRRRAGYRAVRRGIAVCMARLDMRIVHASIQANHVHLLVEANDEQALSRGLRAFMTACARRINAHLGRRGRVFAGRYHLTVITSPRHARSALCYVLNNWRRHHEDRAATSTRTASVDPYSTGILFDGWAGRRGRFAIPDRYDPLPVAGARSWLLTVGWRSHPPIRLREVPGPEPR
ncbi:MAG: transposase [Deltaproteobacteria bacterium]|nr:transposase [Deltaproteobacteria bacterium]